MSKLWAKANMKEIRNYNKKEKTPKRWFYAKFREKGLKKHLGKGKENENHVQIKEKEEKKKKRSWWKWLSSVRGHWSCQGTHSSDKKAEMIVTNSLKGDDDQKVNSNPTMADIIPIETEEKISEILIKPTETGIKAMIAQYHGSSMYSERPSGDQLTLSNDISYKIKSLERNGEAVKEKCRKTDRKRLSWNTEIFESDTDIAKNHESLLTSALFIHQDMDKIVESAVFIEPHLPKDYVDSNKFDEISQRSLRINKREVKYKILEDKNDQILKTFKSVSEPTWDERKKIIRQKRLQDNINNLLEQFMLLEVEDVFSLPMHQNKLKESKRKIGFTRSSHLNLKEPLIKKISREVSPEILVNIKPFKEYVSDEFIDIKESSTELILKNHVFGSKDHMKKTTEVGVGKSKISYKNEKISKETIFPFLKCAIKTTVENDKGDAKKSYCKSTEKTLSLSDAKENVKNTSHENCAEDIFDFASIQPNNVTPCTVWGLYRSYSTCTSLADEKEDEGEKGKQQSKNSLDEVLNNLDDSDHDVIFRKNISQFRRKINAMPRLEVKKSATYSRKMEAAKMNSKNIQTSEICAMFMEPFKNSLEQMKAVSLKISSKKKTGAFRLDCLNLWKHRQKQEKILENIFLQLSEAKMIFRPRIEATRIEARTISFAQTLREVHDMLESNSFAVMEIEMPMSFEKNLKNMELLWVGSSETLQWSVKPLVDVKKYITVAVVLSFQGQDFDGKFCTTENDVGMLGKHILQSSKFFPNTSECFYLVQNQLLTDYAQKSISNVNALNASEMFSSACLESSKKTKNDKEELISVREEKHTLKIYEPIYKTHFGFAEILNKSFYEYVARIYDCVFFSLDTSCENQLQFNAFENNLNNSYSAPTLPNLKNSPPGQKENPSSEFVSQPKKKTIGSVNDEKSSPDYLFDGFQILYNNSKESLDDEEETIKIVFAKHLLEKNFRNAFFSKTDIFKKEKELQDDDDDDDEEEEEEERQKKKNGCSNKEVKILKILEKKVSRALKYKSKSSPRETIYQTEFCSHEHRMRRSLILSKETEKEFHGCKKRRLSFDKDVEVRKTASALLDPRMPAMTKEKSALQEKSSFGIKETFQSRLVLPFELKTPIESEPKNMEKKKMFGLEKSGMNVRKEVVAAFNSIKELNKCKGETKGGHKRLSVVIMVSRK